MVMKWPVVVIDHSRISLERSRSFASIRLRALSILARISFSGKGGLEFLARILIEEEGETAILAEESPVNLAIK